MVASIIGWDIGGAHIKAVHIDQAGRVLNAQQLTCPLWMGLDQLTEAVKAVMQSFHLKVSHVKHTITMTGELVDLFSNRKAGVNQIAQHMANLLLSDVWFYQITDVPQSRFISLSQVAQHAQAIASANWHASALWLASQVDSAILVDIGSTTTDIVSIKDSRVVMKGTTDAERMQLGSLIYTGVVRTPVMALSQTLIVDGMLTHIAAEYFATMADVYRLTDELPEGVDMSETADGADKSVISSARRLARMVGYDVDDKSMDIWVDLAHDCRNRHINLLSTVITRHKGPKMKIIGAGAGAFLVEALAKQYNHDFQAMDEVLDNKLTTNEMQQVVTCFPAYAVAQLALGSI